MNLKLTYKYYITILTIVWVAYGAFLFHILAKVEELEIVYSVMLGGVLMHLTLNVFLKRWYKNKRPILLDWFRLSTFLFVILNFFTLINSLNTEVDAFKDYVIPKLYILPSVLVLLVGVFGLIIGEYLAKYFFETKKEIIPKVKYNYQLKSTDFFSITAVIIGFIQLFLMLKGEVGYGVKQENTTSDISFLFQFVFISSTLILSIFSIFKYLYNYNSRTFNNIFIFYFTIQVLYGFLSGMKESIIAPFVIVLIPYLLGGNKIPKKLFYLSLFLGILIYPLNDNYRVVLREMPSLPKNKALLLAAGKTFTIGLSDNLSKGTGNFSDRLSLFPYLVYSVEKEESWTYYKNMDRYIYLPVAWILPRVVIPDKPKSEIGEVLNYMIRGWSGNSLTVTTYGWAYFEGGYFYVLILFAFFAFFISYFEYNLGLESCLGLILYIEILIVLLKVENDIYFLVSGILQSCLITYIFYKIFIKEKRLKLIQNN